ncbi:MAG: hypothetical protein J7502_00015 [Flavisolibacter sp.]|nr:hypothetical protein [Flavisolibacter sp.]
MKKMLLPMLALAAGIAFSAFTQPKEALTSEAWFLYNSGLKTKQDSYSYSASNPGCNSNGALCAVRAEIDVSTIEGDDITTAKPMESGDGIKSLQSASSESSLFTQQSANVQLHN